MNLNKITIIHNDYDHKSNKLIEDYLNIFKNIFGEDIYLHHIYFKKKAKKTDKINIKSQVKDSTFIIVLVNKKLIAKKGLNIDLKFIANDKTKKLLVVVKDVCYWNQQDWTNGADIFPRSNTPFDKLNKSKKKETIASLFSQLSKYFDELSKKNVDKSIELNLLVSYSREDGDFVDLLKYKLQEENFKVNIDLEFINAGDNWKLSIDNAIKNAGLILVICSASSKVSEYVIYEWSFALGHNKKILPIKIEDVKLHPKLKELQFIDFSIRSMRPWNKLANNIRKLAMKIEK